MKPVGVLFQDGGCLYFSGAYVEAFAPELRRKLSFNVDFDSNSKLWILKDISLKFTFLSVARKHFSVRDLTVTSLLRNGFKESLFSSSLSSLNEAELRKVYQTISKILIDKDDREGLLSLREEWEKFIGEA